MSVLKRIFKSDKAAKPQVPIFKVLMVAKFISWESNSTFVLVKRDTSHLVFVKVGDQEWSAQEQPDLQTGVNRMNSLVQKNERNYWEPFDWKPAVDSGLLTQPLQSNYGPLITYGYAKFDLENYSKDILNSSLGADLCFSIGRELDKAFDSGWLPESINDYQILEYYLGNAPLQAGYFGPFKNILKRLTKVCQNPEKVNADLLKVLGMAYGRVEAKTTGLRISLLQCRQDYYFWNLGVLSELPGFTGNRHPSLKTLQYLARKGLRLYNYLLGSEHRDKVDYFELSVLASANYWHNSKHLEEKYLSGQILISAIIYRGSNLAVRDPSGRKMILDSKSERHTFLAPGSVTKYDGGTPIRISEIESIVQTAINPNNFLANAAIVQYLFVLAMTNGFSLNLTSGAIRVLEQSENPRVKEKLIEYLILNPEKFAALPSEVLNHYLESGDNRIANAILVAFERSVPTWFPWNSTEHKEQQVLLQVLRNWIDKHAVAPLSQEHLEMALRILAVGWNKLNFNFNQSRSPVIALLLRVMQDSNIAENKEIVDLISHSSIDRDWSNPFADISAVFGTKANEKYPQGILDIYDLSDSTLLVAFGSMLANSLRYIWAEEHAINAFFDSFFKCTKKGALDLMVVLSQDASLSQNIAEALKQQLAKHDPAGSTYVKSLKLFVSNGDRSGLLRLLTQLSEEDFVPFWRRNEKEIKEIFSDWVDSASFIWSNLDTIPLRTIEFLCSVDNFDRRLLESLTPRTISRMDALQTDFFVRIMKRSTRFKLNESLIRALIVSPSAELNQIGADFAKSNDLMDELWLLMIESNLPVSVNTAASYLADCKTKKDFVPKLLMALDSNNQTARKRALEVLADTRDVLVMKSVVSALLENRNPDTWKTVYTNLGLLDEGSKIQSFTEHVFLSRRKARRDKETLKMVVDQLTEQIDDLISDRTLIRMSRSSIAADREWALRKIASSEQTGEAIIIEKTWG